ncbi:glucosaminidase [Saccharobesus litoralis]|uniref:Glucosaminidase n=2 Tax=Saccharobesus litoralis TaxID=2172099 RepID=A0A2S0VUQ4_9ALTE|nr:glucosaminidase [Saccharobesus litoralis]
MFLAADKLRNISLLLLLASLLAACQPITTDQGQDVKRSPSSTEPKQSEELTQLLTTIPSAKPGHYAPETAEQLGALLDKLYQDARQGEYALQVPRVFLQDVSTTWLYINATRPVQFKKTQFFRLMLPLVLQSNLAILSERRSAATLSLKSKPFKELCIKYGVITRKALSKGEKLTSKHRTQLLRRVDIVPPSLALAQAAEESGWATSRFTLEGNALFGQWDFSGKGMIPKEQRTELGNYGLARFKSPLDSVKGYMLNLNRNRAYAKLRQLRHQNRMLRKPSTGLALATTLDKYSERGQHYVDGVQSLIRYNKLQKYDEAVLANSSSQLSYYIYL